MSKKNIDIAIFIPKNNSILMANIISLMLLFILTLYLVPTLFVSLFETLLGNLLLILIVFGVGYYHLITGIILAFGFILFYQISHLSYGQKKEGFLVAEANVNMELDAPDGATRGPWPADLVEKFLQFQKVLNPDVVYDMKVLQKQATPEEVVHLFKHNQWPWSKKVQELYEAAIAQNLYISIDPGIALTDAQSIYNQKAVVELLSFQTKEGKFLINGATIGHTKGLPENINNVAVCGIDGKGNSILNKVLYTGYDGFDGHMIENITPIENKDVPSVVNGFKFLKGECNPCLALNSPSDYSCPFSLNVGDGEDVSTVWKMLWGLNPSVGQSSETKEPDLNSSFKLNPEVVPSASSSPGSSSPSLPASSSPGPSSSSPGPTSPNEFPLLSQLTSELGKLPFLDQIKNELIQLPFFSKLTNQIGNFGVGAGKGAGSGATPITFNSSEPNSMSSTPASVDSRKPYDPPPKRTSSISNNPGFDTVAG